MRVRDIDPDTIIKLGMVDGSGFVYAGRAGDCDWTTLNHQAYEDDWDAFAMAASRTKRMRGRKVSKKWLTLLLKRAKAVQDYVPVYDREIIDQYRSAIEDALIVIVDGASYGRIWMVDETPHPKVEIRHAEGAINLVGEIYKGICGDLEASYVSAILGESERDRVCARIAAQKYEAQIRMETFGMIKDTEWVIEMVRKNAAERISSGMVEPQAEVLEWIERAMR